MHVCHLQRQLCRPVVKVPCQGHVLLPFAVLLCNSAGLLALKDCYKNKTIARCQVYMRLLGSRIGRLFL